jgi:hypothetical protein
MRVSQVRIARCVGSIALGCLVALAGALPVAADTEVGHFGVVGRHRLVDTTAKPGVRCDYLTGDGREGAATLTVRPPRVFARNRTPVVDSQMVGYRVRLQQSEDFVHWYTDFNSPIVKATASDTTKASFPATTVDVPFNLYVRVQVVMFWFAIGTTSSIEGRAIHAVDIYDRFLDGTFEDQLQGACPTDLTP